MCGKSGAAGLSLTCFPSFISISKDVLYSVGGASQLRENSPCFYFSAPKNWNDQDHLAFLLTHLSDMLELLLEPEQLGASSHATHNSLVSYEAVCALSFLIEGTVNNTRTIHPLHELALWQPCHGQNGYSKISKTFSFPKLENWLRSCLIINPFGMTACLRSGKKLAWAQQGICRFYLYSQRQISILSSSW